MSFVVAVLMFSWPAALAAASEAHIVKQFSLPRNLSNSLSEPHIERHCPSAYMFDVYVTQCSGDQSKISLSLWCSQTAHKQSSNGPEIEPQISLLGGAEEPLMYLAHSHHHCPLIILLSGNTSSRGRKLQIKLKTSFAQSRDFDIQFLMPSCRREIVFLRMPWQGGW